MFRVLITGAIHSQGVDKLNAEPDIEVDFRPDMPADDIMEIIGGYHALITRSETAVDRKMIDAAKELKVIARAAVGVANIDAEYATEKGILVLNTPGKNTNSAAELSFGLLLSAVRKIIPADREMRNLKWNRHKFAGAELMDKTIGIVGLGNVGHRMAKFSHGFDMRVIACDPYIADEVFERHKVEKVDLETLICESDIISVHVPKNAETTGMIGINDIPRMKDGVILVNAARGGIIDESALLAGLRSGKIAAAGLDTWVTEPLAENPFIELENVVMTPHIGASTEAAQRRVAESIATQVPRALRGGVVDSPVNMPQIRMLEGDLMTTYTVLAEKLGQFADQFIDFEPQKLDILYRGSIARQDCTLIRLALLKGFLMERLEYVSYVNAEQRAESCGLQVINENDLGFTDYENAVLCTFSAGDKRFSIGGVVFTGPHPRITKIDDFPVEIEPEGTFLAIRSLDKLGVVTSISSTLDKHKIQIHDFEFSHSDALKRSMFLIRVGRDIPDEVMEELRSQEHITQVRKILI